MTDRRVNVSLDFLDIQGGNFPSWIFNGELNIQLLRWKSSDRPSVVARDLTVAISILWR